MAPSQRRIYPRLRPNLHRSEQMRRCILLLVTFAALLVVAAPASADLRRNGRWVWRSIIQEGDPVNVFFSGGNTFGGCSTYHAPDKSSACAWQAIVSALWQRGDMYP